jgi:hypothetical protein
MNKNENRKYEESSLDGVSAAGSRDRRLDVIPGSTAPNGPDFRYVVDS